MAKGQLKIGAAAAKFYGKHEKGLQEAKKAENMMQTCAMPIGWKGDVVVVGAVADRSKDRKDQKGNTVEGNDYHRIEFQVIGDPDYAGKKASIGASFYTSEKATAEDRYSWWLNQLENLGLPRDIRENHEGAEELLGYFTNSDETFEMEIVKASYVRQGGDGKEVVVRRKDVVDTSTSMAPPTTTASGTTQVQESKTYAEGSQVSFADNPWTVVSFDEANQTLKIKSPRNGSVREIKVSELD